ncbi:nif11-like leader peptide domain protein [Synechococcus sp. BIOS-E4-1]|uniref:Nif11-like leader peptide family RiPP precursor n=1 Tax=Synechococcus sp. BIOS-E4-1 TaxID=1400864 RepID=UPI00164622C0|nr:Nif11-like leader peptide family RiPP precursor [Synechococcus sp. BIOS-E4-1]QNI54382.1 nif11-like leader peptide domain protein [Synechococcus sp. BIOS-E4-1]
MSEEQLKAFLEKVKADTSLQDKLKGDDVDAAFAITKEAGFVITTDEIKQAQSGIKELSGNELDIHVVAGFWKS